MAVQIHIQQINSKNPLLGRDIEHDPRSFAYPVRRAIRLEEPRTVLHNLQIGVLDQRVGSCTCHTITNLQAFTDHWATLSAAQRTPMLEDGDSFAEDFYRETTRNDEFPGAWEPNDTGSSGLAAAKTSVRRGYSKGYVHAFSVEEALSGLNVRPFGFGTWWYSSMFYPNSDGVVSITAGARREGGHEYAAIGHDTTRGLVRFRNSWGYSWGKGGDFYMSTETFARLMHEDGDAIFLIPLDAPTPEPDWDLMLAKPLKDWAYSRPFSRWTKAGKAAAASREWLTRKGL